VPPLDLEGDEGEVLVGEVVLGGVVVLDGVVVLVGVVVVLVG
jgi:hypothetical protein